IPELEHLEALLGEWRLQPQFDFAVPEDVVGRVVLPSSGWLPAARLPAALLRLPSAWPGSTRWGWPTGCGSCAGPRPTSRRSSSPSASPVASATTDPASPGHGRPATTEPHGRRTSTWA